MEYTYKGCIVRVYGNSIEPDAPKWRPFIQVNSAPQIPITPDISQEYFPTEDAAIEHGKRVAEWLIDNNALLREESIER